MSTLDLITKSELKRATDSLEPLFDTPTTIVNPIASDTPMPSLLSGDSDQLIPFEAYLRTSLRLPSSSTHWPSSAITKACSHFPHGERGSVALVTTSSSAEAAPGISLAAQIINPGGVTNPHRHAFWHLYLVVSGSGTAYIGNTGCRAEVTGEHAYSLAVGDALYVPPWATHRFANLDADSPCVLYALQNLPQLAALGTLIRETSDGGIEHVYREFSDPAHSSLTS